jgi:sugar phosphate isomerase/epimerase
LSKRFSVNQRKDKVIVGINNCSQPMTHRTLTPKISLGSWAFSFGPFASAPWSFERFCKYTAEAGFDGVEINGFRPHPHPLDFNSHTKRAALKGFLADLNLGVSGYAPDFREVPPSLAPADSYLDVVRSCLDFMFDLEIKVLRVDSVSPPEPLDNARYEQRFEQLSHTWRRAAKMCHEAGVTLVWEHEPGFWLNKPSEVLRLVKHVSHPAFKLLFDTTHSYMGAVVGSRQTGVKEILPGGLQEYASLLSPHIGHLHLMDSDGTLHDNETSTHTPFGQGLVQFPQVLRALQPTLDHLPWWCLDFCFCPTTQKDARTAAPYVRALARSMEIAQ